MVDFGVEGQLATAVTQVRSPLRRIRAPLQRSNAGEVSARVRPCLCGTSFVCSPCMLLPCWPAPTVFRLAVVQVVDIEESVWSPLYGLKGKIDASLRVATRGRGPPRTTVMPFELKTGKSTTGFVSAPATAPPPRLAGRATHCRLCSVLQGRESAFREITPGKEEASQIALKGL